MYILGCTYAVFMQEYILAHSTREHQASNTVLYGMKFLLKSSKEAFFSVWHIHVKRHELFYLQNYNLHLSLVSILCGECFISLYGNL